MTLEEKYEAARARKELLEGLKEHKGWKLLAEALASNLRQRRIQSFSMDVASLDKAIELATSHAQAGGIQFAYNFLDALIDEATAEFEAIADEVEATSEEGMNNG